jgi:hypothetical protein
LPYQRVRDDLGIERTREEVSFWSAVPRDYLAAPPINRLWNEPLAGNHRDIERDLFPGALIVVLAGVGLANRRGGRERWVLLAVTLGSVALSFGLAAELLGRDWPLPYRAFYDLLPGFRAIRVPARFGLVALVGLGGLAGLGVDLLWRVFWPRVRDRKRTPQRFASSPLWVGGLALVVGLGAIGLEALPRMELPGPLPNSDDEAPPAYAWIREHPAPTLELPMGEGPVASAWPNFWSMLHWNQTVNGYSGIVPPTYYAFRERMKTFPSDDTLWLLQGIGVRNVILHADFHGTTRAAVEAEIAGQPELSLALSGPDAVYLLAPDPWMMRIAVAVPSGETVDLPNAAADPLAFGLLMAVLQRHDLTVSGNGQIDYVTLKPAESPRCYAVLLTGDDPAAFGYAGATAVRQEPGMTLWRRAGCD